MKCRTQDVAARKKTRKRARQLELVIPTWGGARKHAGRKRVAARARVRHRRRAPLNAAHPVHVTLRMRDDVPNLRQRNTWMVIVRVLRSARERFGVTVHQYAVLGNHLHLLVEHTGGASLSRGMRGLCTRLAARLNQHFGRTGPLLADRYHARPLTTPLEARRGLAYVLLNFRKHAGADGRKIAASWIDPCSSGLAFTGWRTRPRSRDRSFDYGTSPARTWLLRTGWQKHGALACDESPPTGPPSPPNRLPSHRIRA
jgi:REP element-mobilizing transposase RayT